MYMEVRIVKHMPQNREKPLATGNLFVLEKRYTTLTICSDIDLIYLQLLMNLKIICMSSCSAY